MKRHLVGLIIVALLISACSGDKATATPRPTATSLPPTATPLPPTATPVPPTATPENAAPVISGLVDQAVPDGESFPEFQLDDYVTDANHADDEITWSYAGNVDLKVRLIVVKGELTVKVPDDEWRGTETIRLEACDPQGLCDAVDVAFTVLDENDAPVVDVDDQTIFPGETFAEITLDERVRDVDNTADEITWSASGNLDLGVSITDGVLAVGAPDAEWRGAETIRLQACDVGGACGSADVAFAVFDGSTPIAVHFDTEDGITLAATLFGEGEIAVILGHMGEAGVTQASWQPFARHIAARGFAALTLDFRGRGGSEGQLRQGHLIRDVNAAIEFLREHGYERIVCIGASMGGTACMRAAIDHDLDGLGVIASPMSIGIPTQVSRQEFHQLTMPKLFVCAEHDGYGLASATELMYEISPEPKQIKIFADQTEHGTSLFDTDVGDEFRELLVSFLEGL